MSEMPDFPLSEAMGMEISDGVEGVCTASLAVQPFHLNPHGVVHGSVPYFLIDTAMGGAAMSVLPDGTACTTVEISTCYLAPCVSGTITATARVRRAGKRLVFLDGVVTGEDGTEYVSASGVFATIRHDPTSTVSTAST